MSTIGILILVVSIIIIPLICILVIVHKDADNIHRTNLIFTNVIEPLVFNASTYEECYEAGTKMVEECLDENKKYKLHESRRCYYYQLNGILMGKHYMITLRDGNKKVETE